MFQELYPSTVLIMIVVIDLSIIVGLFTRPTNGVLIAAGIFGSISLLCASALLYYNFTAVKEAIK